MGRYLINCLNPNTGLVTGSDAPVRIDSVNIAALIRCEPDAGQNAVRVSQATGDVGPLLSALASRPSASSTSTGKQTVFVVEVRADRNDPQRLAVASGAVLHRLLLSDPAGSLG